METHATLILLLEQTRKIHDLLDEYVNRVLQTPSGQLTDNELPEHVDITGIAAYFEISKSTFYNEVEGKLLEPVLSIGRRPYYLKSDIADLMKKGKKKQPGIKKWIAQQRKNDK